MRHLATELLHVLASVVVTALIASLAAWSVPLAGATIWDVSFVVMAVLVALAIPSLRQAWRADHGGVGALSISTGEDAASRAPLEGSDLG